MDQHRRNQLALILLLLSLAAAMYATQGMTLHDAIRITGCYP